MKNPRTTLKIAAALFFVAAAIFSFNIGRSLSGEGVVNNVRILHLTVLSSRSYGDYLMVETSKGDRTELVTFNVSPPKFQAGDKLDLEVWKDNTYVFKADMRGDETTYHEDGYGDRVLGDN